MKKTCPLSNIVALKMCRKPNFESLIIIFAWFLFPTTNGKLVPCNVSVESKVCFIVNDYVTTGIEK